ncbi:type IV toxin-antitoxin system AbiEi family antitoxin domain-containing protein [Geodermatophilus pulveris]|uniref:type IV toxin-antitoxin system AbiEi family antitoxin domain-containing protein n=1 Tax=Geodermatophilus pulveris TaxID=1564159 RepID=UPI000B78361C|nr:type IV toxin-antitoxin system AbiEi family antitoxin domain-containing protein [Geodermatophilus pulveris]
MDFALYRLIAAQGGVFTTSQALDHCGDTGLRALVRSGRWRRSRYRGVLVGGEVPDTPALLVRAAALAVGGDLVACHSTAAALWGFDVLGPGTLHFLGPPEVGNRRRPGIQVHPSSLGTEDAVLVDGVWCTPAARTACDVVRLTPAIDGLATLDAALRSGSCTREQLAGAAEAQAGLRQVAGCGAWCRTPTHASTPRWSPGCAGGSSTPGSRRRTCRSRWRRVAVPGGWTSAGVRSGSARSSTVRSRT